MVNSIQQIGNVMGIKTIAEFVESPEIVQRLQTLGVDYMQGREVGEPLPLDELLNTGHSEFNRAHTAP
jgi:EAL domain-containing protein (putative c-di-GMP-specific phosphodiesterase class I)